MKSKLRAEGSSIAPRCGTDKGQDFDRHVNNMDTKIKQSMEISLTARLISNPSDKEADYVNSNKWSFYCGERLKMSMSIFYLAILGCFTNTAR